MRLSLIALLCTWPRFVEWRTPPRFACPGIPDYGISALKDRQTRALGKHKKTCVRAGMCEHACVCLCRCASAYVLQMCICFACVRVCEEVFLLTGFNFRQCARTTPVAQHLSAMPARCGGGDAWRRRLWCIDGALAVLITSLPTGMGEPECSSRFRVPGEAPPLQASDYNGYALPDVCFGPEASKNVYVVGDWGGILFKADMPPLPADKRSKMFASFHRIRGCPSGRTDGFCAQEVRRMCRPQSRSRHQSESRLGTGLRCR